jgi:hypothetical protein
MAVKKALNKDKELKEFIKSGGRKNAENDFDTILKLASKPKTVTNPLQKKK